MATFIPHPQGDDDNRLELTLEQARDFAERFCQPKDNTLVEDFDETAREAAWRLLQALELHQHNEGHICEKCQAAEEEKESIEEKVEENVETISDNTTIDKLTEIAENNKEILKKAAAVGAVAATTQAAEAATVEVAKTGIKASISMFIQETTAKTAAIGTAGLMSIGSGAYFQAKTVKNEGIEVAVVTEQEYGVFSSMNEFSESIFGVSPFGAIVEYAEKGYGDIEGTGLEGGGENGDGGSGNGGEDLIDEEQSKRFKEAAEKKKELEEKGILPKIEEELEKDKSVTPVGNE
jgi:hypothetical protein